MNRNSKLLWSADFTSVFGSSLYSLALTLLAFEVTDNVFSSGIVLFLTTIPYFVFGFISGSIIDKVDKKKIMLFCDFIRAILVLSIPLLDVLDYLNYGYIILVGILMTVFRTLFFPANQASVKLLVTNDKELNTVNSYAMTQENSKTESAYKRENIESFIA
ncbi:MFS transporter [Bacillus sp. NPDC093026]|uniref:MFS transporter n=1 Tax=Bacillus sp. NPDC093026 TaxID=3363948 RepID=UPI0037F913B5